MIFSNLVSVFHICGIKFFFAFAAESLAVEKEELKKEREKARKEAEEQFRLEQEKIAKLVCSGL